MIRNKKKKGNDSDSLFININSIPELIKPSKLNTSNSITPTVNHFMIGHFMFYVFSMKILPDFKDGERQLVSINPNAFHFRFR